MKLSWYIVNKDIVQILKHINVGYCFFCTFVQV